MKGIVSLLEEERHHCYMPPFYCPSYRLSDFLMSVESSLSPQINRTADRREDIDYDHQMKCDHCCPSVPVKLEHQQDLRIPALMGIISTATEGFGQPR